MLETPHSKIISQCLGGFVTPGDVRAAHSKTAHVHCLSPGKKLVFSNRADGGRGRSLFLCVLSAREREFIYAEHGGTSQSCCDLYQYHAASFSVPPAVAGAALGALPHPSDPNAASLRGLWLLCPAFL